MTSTDVEGGTTQRRRAIDFDGDDTTRYGRRLSDRMRSTFDESSVLCADQDSLLLHLVEVSVVMPCLNEEESVGICVMKALAGLAACGVAGEVIVCDNGSSDNSVEVARNAGARVVNETARGYGNAYLTGFDAATGRIIVMGDSDDSYDFTQLGALVNKINEGYDYVLGSRFGGEIRQGAMSWSHRYIGNPVLTAVLNRFFGLKSSDAHSGMRAFTREALDRMALRCEGMEFASEIVVKAARANLRVAEVPIVYHPRIGESKLNSLKDGWRHLRFLLLLSPVYLFLLPGMAMFIVGITGQAVLLGMGSSVANTNASLLSAILAVTGIVTLIFGVFSQTFLESLEFQQGSRCSLWLDQKFSLERYLGIGAGTIVFGLVVELYVWTANISSDLNGRKLEIGSVMLIAMGLVVIFGSFFLSIFKVRLHGTNEPRYTDERSE